MQGQSSTTRRKVSDFEGLFGINIAMVQAIFRKAPDCAEYVHFDLNAGCGFNHEAGCDGSPLAFLNAAMRHRNIQFNAHFVDSDTDSIKELRSRLMQHDSGHLNLRCYNEDNRDFLRLKMAALAGERAFGSILLDPNNFDLPFEDIADAISGRPKIDLILSVGFTTPKRVRDKIPFSQAVSNVASILRLKRHWLIRERDGKWQWSILVGRNMEAGDWKARGFYKLTDPKGMALLEESIISKTERQDNHEFHLLELHRILKDSGVSVSPSRSNEVARQSLLPLWSESNRNASRMLSTVGTA